MIVLFLNPEVGMAISTSYQLSLSIKLSVYHVTDASFVWPDHRCMYFFLQEWSSFESLRCSFSAFLFT